MCAFIHWEHRLGFSRCHWVVWRANSACCSRWPSEAWFKRQSPCQVRWLGPADFYLIFICPFGLVLLCKATGREKQVSFEPIPAQNKLTKNKSLLFIPLHHNKKLEKHLKLRIWDLFRKAWIFLSCTLIILLTSYNYYVEFVGVPYSTSSRCCSLAKQQVSLQHWNSYLNLVFFKCEILKQRYRIGTQAY